MDLKLCMMRSTVLMRSYIMKRRSLDPETPVESAKLSLYEALLSLKNADEMGAFMRDLCTPAELEVLVDRWRVVPYLLEGVSYREIHERTAVSITTIGRVARYLNQGSGGYLAAAARAARRLSLATKKVRA
jgi:TrpR-related protein YerC/YecD